MTMDERKYRILRAIIDDYILTAMPVGSRTISRKYDMGLSSATIRNEMSDLEELGYLDQPYTSAGRIPSYRAYRLYVEKFMQIASLPKEENDHIRDIFVNRMGEMENTMRRVAEAAQKVFPHVAVTYAEGAASSNPYAVDFDDSPLCTEFGFRPEYTIERAIRDYARSRGVA